MPHKKTKNIAKDDKPSLVAAGFFLRRIAENGEKRWLLLRNAERGEWGFPKGHAEKGETLVQTALRECGEECGIGLCAIVGAPMSLRYVVPWGRSKEVVYFPAQTTQESVTLSKEHDQAKWFTTQEVYEALAKFPNLLDVFSEMVAAWPHAR